MEASVSPKSSTDAVTADVAPMNPARVRPIVWGVLLILGGLQAWASRFTTTPDGMSYVDLSDAVVNGHLGQLVNAYWSPLYPALLGLLRLVLRPGPFWEFPTQHLLNLLLFAGSILGFEYFLNALSVASASWGRTELQTAWGRLAAYAVFGVFSLMMTPLTLPTPDLLVTTSVFVSLGALLRLRHTDDHGAAAIALGLALAAGSLAKSFCIPWSVVCLACAVAATRKRFGWLGAGRSIAIWMAVVVPWCVVLSLSVGRPTFGDTGRLTYVWYVNQIESPSSQVMPHAAATAATDSILKGVAITPDARGTNPVWYDPSRWYGDLRPSLRASQQLKVFSFLVSQYVSSLIPVILLLWFAVAIARRDDRRAWWDRTWVAMAPSIIAIGAYSLVLITTRYVAPFYVVIILVIWVGLRWPSRLNPRRVAIGIGIPFLVMVTTPGSGDVISYENAAVGAVLFVWLGRRWGPRGMVASGVVGALCTRILQPASLRGFLIVGSVLIVLFYWLSSRWAIHRGEARHLSMVVRKALVTTSALLVGLVAVLKYKSSIQSPRYPASDPNLSWRIAENLRAAGVGRGAKIAIVGAPFDNYWARTGGLHIVGVIPLPATGVYEALPLDRRDRLFREFSRAGASVVIELRSTRPATADSGWVPVQYLGWMKRLPTS